MVKPVVRDDLEPPIPNGGPRPSELMMAVCEVLDDFQWHDQDKVIGQCGKVIPPGQALRAFEKKSAIPKGIKTPRSTERLIESGKRRLIVELLFGEAFEKRPTEGGAPNSRQVRMVRLPSRVYYERSRRLAHSLLSGSPQDLVTALARVSPRTTLSLLTHEQLLEVAVVLAGREKERVLRLERQTDQLRDLAEHLPSRPTALQVFADQQMWAEAEASVALDHGDVQTISIPVTDEAEG